MNRRPSEDMPPPKRFLIQRKRLGTIRFMRPDGEFGFIDAEDFREDVFFHWRAWETADRRAPAEGMWVEYEIDEEYREAENRLRAKVVRPTNRPEGKRLSGRDAPHLVMLHHPNARKKRPDWRGKKSGGDSPT